MAVGVTFNLQQFSTEDGPGIRTTVFLKGCPLSCVWCHNPEGRNPRPELVWHDVRCIGARDCVGVCEDKALSFGVQGVRIDRGRCTVCGACVEACPAGALEVIGRNWSPEEMMEELLKDRVFYESSGGGVTFSGGEPMAQVEFLCEVLPQCKQEGLHVALDTSGAASQEQYERIIRWVDLVLYDLKVMDPAGHEAATGVPNAEILLNARWLSSKGVPMWIRTPVIPGYTNDPGNIRAIGRFIREALPTVEQWDLLAYTNLGRPKYHRQESAYLLEDVPLMTREEIEAAWLAAAELVPTAKWSGATRPATEVRP